MDYVTAQSDNSLDFLKSFDWDEKNWVVATPENQNQNVTSVWEEMATGISSVGSNVWDATKGAWISTKEVVSDAYAGIKTEIKETGGGILDYLQNKLIILVLLILALLYVAGKSGLFSAVVAVAK